jgi:hypothetical protein
MFLQEFKAMIGKIDSERTIYEVRCDGCIAYADTSSPTGIITGWADLKEPQDFYKLGKAKAAIRLHKDTHPLHKPRILRKITEYLTHSSKYMKRYRMVNDIVHVYYVNGFRISSDKCAFACKKCGAIYKSKALYGHSFFPTSDLKCKAEVHSRFEKRQDQIVEYNLEKICICPDLNEREQLEEEKLHQEWCKATEKKLSNATYADPLL